MLRKIIAVMLFCLFAAGCSSVPFGSKNIKEDESEIIIICASTIYKGRYNLLLNGEANKTVKGKGGTSRFIVPNGQHVIIASWADASGLSGDIDSIKVDAFSNRIFLFVNKASGQEKLEIVFLEQIDLL